MSDQADKAAENRIAVQNLAIICFHRGWNAHREKMKKASPEWIELRNRCAHEMSDLFESLRSHTAPRELVDAVKAMVLLVEDYEAKTCKVIRAAITIGKSDWKAEAKERELAMHKMFEFLDVLRSALSEQKPKVCEWVDDDPYWKISCQKVGLSHSFHEPVIVRKWKACPYCTNPIEVKEG